MTVQGRAATARRLDAVLRRLAEADAGDLPLLSVYLDVRPEATGQSPGRRASFTVLRDRLREIEQTYWPRGADYDSFSADRDRIEQFLEDDLDPATEGLAVFACDGIGLWEVVQAGVPFRDSVSAGPTADLFQLARLADEHETAVVALVDSNTSRLFVSRAGRLREAGGPDENPESFRKRDIGGWSQARYQRHIDKHIADFAEKSAKAIERLVAREDAQRVILAGDEVAITPLEEALPQAVRDKVGEVLRIGIRADRDEIAADVREAVERLEAEASTSAADRLIGAVRAGGLGVVGVDETRRMLELGAVDTLVLIGLPGEPPHPEGGHDARPLQDRGEIEEEAASSSLDLDTRNELVRQAALTDADVDVLDAHEALERAGGVGALLRFRPD